MIGMVLMLLTATQGLAWSGQVLESSPTGEQRIALVIGNSNYEISPLTNPVNDARGISDTLRRLGFEVVTLLNANYAQMVEGVRRFGDQARGKGGVALFYFAGHGIQMEGANYLIPVGADIRKEHEVKYNTLNVNQVLDEMAYSSNRINIVILDACRNNPFARSFRSMRQGLAQIDASSGTLIAFATAPGSVASDGKGENGLYTEKLLEQMVEPGTAVEQVFKHVRANVMQETNDEQVPWESSSLIGDFYFNPAPPSPPPGPAAVSLPRPIGPATPTTAPPVPPTAPIEQMPVDPKVVERTYWNSLKGSKSASDYQAYLQAYPDGLFAALAKVRVRRYGDASSNLPVATTLRPPVPVPPPPVVEPVAMAPPPLIASMGQAPYSSEPKVPPLYASPALSTSIEPLLGKARNALDENRLTSPIDDSAAKWCRDVLDLDPANGEAKELLREVVGRYLDWTGRDLERGRIRKAEVSFGRASTLLEFASNDQLATLEDLRMRIAEQRRHPAVTPEPADIPPLDDYRDPEPYPPQRTHYSDRGAAPPGPGRTTPNLSGYLQTIQALVPEGSGRRRHPVSPRTVQDAIRLFQH